MEESNKVAIGRFVMRNKQYTAAIRAEEGRLLMSTLAYADEVLDPATIDELQELDDVEVSAKEIAMAESLVDSLTAAFEPAKYRDEYREQVLDLIQIKASGRGVRGARGGRREAEGRRSHGRARGERGQGEGGRVAGTRRPLRPAEPSAEEPAAKKAARRRRREEDGGEEGSGEAPQEVGGQEVGGQEDRVSASVEVEIEGRQLTLSNLDKVLYPSGFTKAQVIDYMARIAPVAIPHLAGRALTFRRYPDGSDTTGFFEKRCPGHRPPWVGVALGAGRSARRHRVLPHRRDGRDGLGREHGGARDPRADGPRRRSRRAACTGVRLRPGRAGRDAGVL